MMIKAKSLLSFSVSAFCMFGVVSAVAAPGTLSNKPLFLGTSVQPNILWLVDDSGSMDWEVLKSQGALAVHGTGSNSGNLDFTPDNDTERRELCWGYNVMAYNPNLNYVPWTGVDEDGSSYTDKTLTTALNNPYDNDDTDNVSTHYYYLWSDTDNDDTYDSGECPTASASRVYVNTLTADEQKNYANWYSYYRKREYVAKAALSQLIDTSDARMGLATLHNNNSVGTIVEDVDDITVPVDTTAQANKTELMKNLFRINSSGGTPLRQTLDEAGEYFQVGVNPGNGLFGSAPSPTSPILSAAEGGECQQNFSILMSDGYWNGGSPGVGNQDSDSTASPYDGGSYADTVENTLADVAMKYYKTDLAPTYDDNVPVIVGADENNAQHMVTYTVAFGVNGTLTNNPSNTTDAFTWPTPSSNNATTIDDLRHAAWNGRGEFLSASNPETLVTSLQDAISGISAREGSASAVAFNSTSLGTDTLVFQARFDSGGWHGTLLAFEIDENGVGTQVWNAADELDSRDLVTDPRRVITFNGIQGVEFDFPSDYTSLTTTDLGADQIADLLADAPNLDATTDPTEITENQSYGEALVEYLKGDDANEVSNDGEFDFRDRFGERLGDIISSSPQFVSAPNRQYPNLIEGVSNPYSDFRIEKENRDPVVYVGANDGMLHAFDADDGEEILAYIPGFVSNSGVADGLHYLSDTDYGHIAYVDGSPLAADVFVDGDWRTYLVGGMRAGAKGVYVLDVTDPEGFDTDNANSIIKQEFTHNDLGYTYSRPLVGRMNNGRWAAIFGNGYNSDPTGDGRAKLFVLYLDALGGYELLDTEVGAMVSSDCNDASSDCNGLSSPTVLDLNSDGNVDRIYAGDIQGNLWVFDVSDSDENNWDVAYKTTTSEPEPLFSACTTTPCAQEDRQPITTITVADTHPDRRSLTTEPNLMVYFGTGQYVAENDNLTTGLQTMYGIWDAGDSGLTRDDLQEQVITNSATLAGVRELTDYDVDYVTSSEYGWYEDLIDSGERVIVEALSIGDVVIYVTTVPDSSSCNGGGYSYLMAVDRLTGGEPDFPVFDLNNDGVIDDNDQGSGMYLNSIASAPRVIDDKIVISGSDGSIETIDFAAEAARLSSRASWSIVK